MAIRRNNVWLKERLETDRITASKVDREKRVIRDVKILGFESSNRRRYTRPCLEAAPARYERAKVKANHPRKATDPRDVDDTLGWLEGIELREDGLYAREFHYLESHPMAARICEAAERNGELFGFSHNIQGDTEDAPDGTELVHRIHEVRSVDLVDDPATTHGLFEERRRVTIKLRALLEGLKLPGHSKPKVQKAKAKIVKRLLEAGMMDGDMDAPVEAPAADAGEGDHVAALKQGFRAAIIAALDGDGDSKGKLSKIKEILTAQEKLLASGEPVEESDDPDEEEDGKDVKESKELRTLRAERRGRLLCEEAGVQADSALLEALSHLPDEAGMKRLIEREKSRGQAPARRGQEPRAGSGGGTAKPSDQVSDFMAAARG
jgi:hypothetical protein